MIASGRRNFGIWLRIMPPARGSRIEQHQLVAERREVARDGQRGGAGADQGDSLAVGALGGAGAGGGVMSPL